MKTLSQYPGLIGRLVIGHAQRERRRARWQVRRDRAVWTLQWLVDGAVRWLLLPLLKLLVAAIITLGVVGAGLAVFNR